MFLLGTNGTIECLLKEENYQEEGPSPTYHLIIKPIDDEKPSRYMEEYLIRRAMAPREKLPRGAKNTTKEVTPPLLGQG